MSVTALGQLELTNTTDKIHIAPYDTNIPEESILCLKILGCSCYCCCGADSNTNYRFDQVYSEVRTKDQIIKQLEEENRCCTWCLRITAFIMHFIGWYGLFFPFTLLISYIPFIGQIGAFILILFAFFLSLASYFLILALAWLFARPLISLLLIVGVIGLIIATKVGHDQMKKSHIGYNNNNLY